MEGKIKDRFGKSKEPNELYFPLAVSRHSGVFEQNGELKDEPK